LPGAWRLLKNAARLAAGRWEYPANAAWWHEALQRAGFDRVRIEMLAHEGGIAVAEVSRPGISSPSLPLGALDGRPDRALSER
jgi:hypothetical protein